MIYLCLDVGNVLCRFDIDLIVDEISKTFNVSRAEGLYFINKVQKHQDLGLINFRDELREHFDIKSEVILDRLIAVWNQCIYPESHILDKMIDLKHNFSIETAILSNMGTEHKNYLEVSLASAYKKFIFEDSVTHFSCDVGARKPSLIYYQSFLQQYPQFKGAVYVDDLHENLQSSEKFGFRTFHFDLNKNDNLNTRSAELVSAIVSSAANP